MANTSIANAIGFDYPNSLGGISSAGSLDMLPGVATAGGGYSITGAGNYLKDAENMGKNFLDSDLGGVATLALASIVLKGLRPDRETTTSHASSTLGAGTSSNWSPATESLIKLLDGLQSGWTKAGTPKVL